MYPQHMSFSLHLMPTLQSNQSTYYGMGKFFLTTFQILYNPWGLQFFFSSGFIMAQNAVIFNCGGKYFHVNDTSWAYINFCLLQKSSLHPLPWHSTLDIRPVNSLQAKHFTKSYISMHCGMTVPRMPTKTLHRLHTASLSWPLCYHLLLCRSSNHIMFWYEETQTITIHTM